MNLKCLFGFHDYALAVDRSGHRRDYHERCKRCEQPKPHTMYWAFWRAREWESDWGFVGDKSQ